MIQLIFSSFQFIFFHFLMYANPVMFAYLVSPKSETQLATSSGLTPAENLLPFCQSHVPACFFSKFPLSPNPEEVDVANGITVFPSKSLSCTKLFTGHAAIPHLLPLQYPLLPPLYFQMPNNKPPESLNFSLL